MKYPTMFNVIDKENGRVVTVYQIGETPDGNPLFFVYDNSIEMWVWKAANDFKPMGE